MVLTREVKESTIEPNSENAGERIGLEAALLSGVEVGLGSLLHAFRVPMSGQFLSLNQAFLLSRVTLDKTTDSPRSAPFQISAIAALLKSLSPAGKKLTPMMAISAQGTLYNLGTWSLGRNLAGALLGALLLSLWAFVQPFLFLYLLYGETLVKVAQYYYTKFSQVVSFDSKRLLPVLFAVVALKLIFAVVVVAMAHWMSEHRYARYLKRLSTVSRRRHVAMADISPGRAALKELFNPLFCFSLALTAFFFLYAEASASQVIWSLLRPVAVGFILFYLVRRALGGDWIARLKETRWSAFACSLEIAIRRLKELRS